MDISWQRTKWYQQNALVLENEILRTVVVPKTGGKLVSLFDKRNEVEWLVGPGSRPLQPVPYGASFVEQDMSGWDEMFPTIVACDYPGPGENAGAPLPDHGEVWSLPWHVEPGPEEQLTLSVAGKALPYRLTRTLSYVAPDTLQLDYRLDNTGRETMPYIWAAHPQFACGQTAEIVLPRGVNRVCNTIPAEWGWGAPETEYAWPEAVNPEGNLVRMDQVGPPTRQQARKFFVLPDVQIGTIALVRKPSRAWLRMAWSPSAIPYFGLWIDEGALSHTSVATPEPTTGFYDSLETAWEKKEVMTVAPGETHSWSLTVQTGTAEELLPLSR